MIRKLLYVVIFTVKIYVIIFVSLNAILGVITYRHATTPGCRDRRSRSNCWNRIQTSNRYRHQSACSALGPTSTPAFTSHLKSRTVPKLSQIIVQIWYERKSLYVYEPPLEGRGTAYAVHLRLVGLPIYSRN